MKTKERKRKKNGANGRRRANCTGTLERRGEKWLARWWVHDAHGKRIRQAQTITPNEDADRGIPYEVGSIDWARTRLQMLTEGNALISREKLIRKNLETLDGVTAELRAVQDGKPALKIEDTWEAFMETRAGRKPSESTRYMYECQFNRFTAWIAANFPDHTEMRHISRKVARAFSDHLLSEYSANTHNKYITLLSGIWDAIARKEEEEADGKTEAETIADNRPRARLAGNPWRNIEREEAHGHDRRELTIEEVAKVANAAQGEMRLLFAVAVHTGLRLADCALLKWSAVDLVQGFISLIPQKTRRTGRRVQIPILPTLRRMLLEFPQKARKGYVMPDMAAQYENEQENFSRHIQAVFKGCGIETQTKEEGERRAHVDVGFHSFRHTFVTLAAQAKIPLAVVQSIVGHGNPKMTEHYLHVSRETLKREMAAYAPELGQAFNDAIEAEEADAVALPAPADDSATTNALADFRRAWGALTAADRKAALDWIARHGGAEGVAE